MTKLFTQYDFSRPLPLVSVPLGRRWPIIVSESIEVGAWVLLTKMICSSVPFGWAYLHRGRRGFIVFWYGASTESPRSAWFQRGAVGEPQTLFRFRGGWCGGSYGPFAPQDGFGARFWRYSHILGHPKSYIEMYFFIWMMVPILDCTLNMYYCCCRFMYLYQIYWVYLWQEAFWV